MDEATILREYVEGALAETGDEFNKALQDLINRLGQLLGFDVAYGRYKGVRSDIGFDGLWWSPTGWSIVVETKTTDAFTVKTAPLLGYINALVSEGRIEHPNKCLGIYVYGRFDTHASQMENAIIAEGRREKLRVVGVSALLNLLELKQEYRLSHETVLGLLRPAPVRIDPLINVISDVVAQEKEDQDLEAEAEKPVERETVPAGAHEPERTETGKGRVLVSIDEDYTGRTITAFGFEGRTYDAGTWKGAAVRLFSLLCRRDRQDFEEAALTIVGRKRPYFTHGKAELRQPARIPDTDLFFEANLSANSMVKLCYTVIGKMGLDRSVLGFEAEA
ncbi:MAG: hypothetical protein PVH50_08915 [Anaerolineae bacterium]